MWSVLRHYGNQCHNHKSKMKLRKLMCRTRFRIVIIGEGICYRRWNIESNSISKWKLSTVLFLSIWIDVVEWRYTWRYVLKKSFYFFSGMWRRQATHSIRERVLFDRWLLKWRQRRTTKNTFHWPVVVVVAAAIKRNVLKLRLTPNIARMEKVVPGSRRKKIGYTVFKTTQRTTSSIVR